MLQINFEERCKKIFAKIIEKYTFLNLTNSKKEQIYNKIITEIKNKALNDETIIDYFEQRSYALLNKILLDNKEFINQLIDSILNHPQSQTEALRELQLFKKILEEKHLSNIFSLIDFALKNNKKINEIIALVVNGNKEFNINRFLDINQDFFFISLFEMYCELNHIENTNDFISLRDLVKDSPEDTFVGSSKEMFVREIISLPPLSKDEQMTLIKRVKNGDVEAEKVFVERNLRLVLFVANRVNSYNTEFVDLVQEGTFGLIRAMKKFNPDLGYTFSTYATPHIKVFMDRYIRKNRCIVNTSYKYEEKIIKYRKAISYLENKLHRLPTNEEVALYMGLDISEIERFSFWSKPTISLNTKINDFEQSEQELADCIKDELVSVEDEGIAEISKKQLIDLIFRSNLLELYKLVIYLNFGFFDEIPLSYVEIGKRLGFSRQRTFQIVTRALVLLKNSKEFINFFDENKKTKRIDKININEFGKINLYDLFNGSSKKDIDRTLLNISEKELLILKSKFGDSLNNKIRFGIDKEDEKIGIILAKMRSKLKNTYNEIKIYYFKERKTLVEDKEVNFNYLIEDGEKVKKVLEKVPKNLRAMLYLRLGLINGKSYTIKSISDFLNIEEYYVKEKLVDFIESFFSIIEKYSKSIVEPKNDNTKIYKKAIR